MIQKLGRLISRQKYFYQFSTQTQGAQSQQQQQTQVVTKQEENQDIPVHMKPYDKAKYEVLSTKLKYSTGYALLDVEPMPRAKIMKICYNVLDRVKETPEDSMYRIYTEEKIKYIMKLTDEIEDIRKLEEELGHDSIELFIQSLSREIDLVDYMKDSKPWIPRDEDLEAFKLGKIKRSEFKHDNVQKPQREQNKFLE